MAGYSVINSGGAYVADMSSAIEASKDGMDYSLGLLKESVNRRNERKSADFSEMESVIKQAQEMDNQEIETDVSNVRDWYAKETAGFFGSNPDKAMFRNEYKKRLNEVTSKISNIKSWDDEYEKGMDYIKNAADPYLDKDKLRQQLIVARHNRAGNAQTEVSKILLDNSGYNVANMTIDLADRYGKTEETKTEQLMRKDGSVYGYDLKYNPNTHEVKRYTNKDGDEVMEAVPRTEASTEMINEIMQSNPRYVDAVSDLIVDPKTEQINNDVWNLPSDDDPFWGTQEGIDRKSEIDEWVKMSDDQRLRKTISDSLIAKMSVTNKKAESRAKESENPYVSMMRAQQEIEQMKGEIKDVETNFYQGKTYDLNASKTQMKGFIDNSWKLVPNGDGVDLVYEVETEDEMKRIFKPTTEKKAAHFHKDDGKGYVDYVKSYTNRKDWDTNKANLSTAPDGYAEQEKNVEKFKHPKSLNWTPKIN